MNEQFQKYSLRIFDELNTEINNKISSLESNDIENKLDKSLNKIIIAKLNKDIENELNFIN